MIWKAIGSIVDAAEKIYDDQDAKKLNPIEVAKKVKSDGVDGAVDAAMEALGAPLSIADRAMDRAVYGKKGATDEQ